MFTDKKIIHLGYSGAGYDPSPAVMDAIMESLSKINSYPYEGYDELEGLIAEYCNVGRKNVMVTNGGDEAIGIITALYGSRVLIPAPTYGEYAYLARSRGAEIRFSNSMHGDTYEVSFSDEELGWASLVWICNPNNPTGTIVPRATITRVLENTKATVVVDEAYYEFSGTSVADLVGSHDNLIVLRTFSKGFGIAGLRLGYILASSEVINRIRNAKQEFNVSRVARAAGIAAMKSRGYYLERVEEAKRVRDDFERHCNSIGITAFKSNAGFVFVKFRDMGEMEYVHSTLMSNGLVTFGPSDSEFSGLSGPYVRIALGSKNDMERAKSEISKAVADYWAEKGRSPENKIQLQEPPEAEG